MTKNIVSLLKVLIKYSSYLW